MKLANTSLAIEGVPIVVTPETPSACDEIRVAVELGSGLSRRRGWIGAETSEDNVLSPLSWGLGVTSGSDSPGLRPVPDRGENQGANRLMIVEDHELLASSLALALEQQGLKVEIVAGPTVEVVVDTVRRLAPVLVLLDLNLGPPLGSGLDLVPALVAAGGRVVMMTGEVDRARLAACVEAGAAGVVSKTVGYADLVRTIRHVVAGEDLLTSHQREILMDELRVGRQADQRRAAPFSSLSPREEAVLVRLVAGESAETIAQLAFVSLATVRSQIRSILHKLGVRSQLAAVALARQANWPPGAPDPSLPELLQPK